MKHFVTAAVFTYPHEIAILKHFLQEAGISFYFENETMLTIVPMYTQALGEIQLKVHINDLDAVRVILAQLDSNNTMKIV